MNEIFVDSAYWIAISSPKDQWRQSALRAEKILPTSARLVTTEEVLSEFLAGLSRRGPSQRDKAVKAVRRIMNDPHIAVVRQSHLSFLRGVVRYKNRLDKGYSVTDCISMNIMKSRSISDVLTSDRHFTQEGFNILMKRPPKPERGGPSSASKEAL